jgi:polyisoprenoid-binding protein YceI
MNTQTSLAITLAIASLAAAPLPALADQKLLPAQSEISFTSKQMGVPVDGRFRKFDAQVAFEPKKPEAAKISFTVDLASATLGSAETDAELAKPDWFSTKLFPQATFQSSSVKATGPGKFEVTGKLAIKSISHDVVVPVTLLQAGDQTTASGSFALKRLDFRIGDGDWKDTSMVADAVLVKFKLVLSGVGPL